MFIVSQQQKNKWFVYKICIETINFSESNVRTYVCMGKMNYLKQNPPYQLCSTLPYLLTNIFLKQHTLFTKNISLRLCREICKNGSQTIPSSNNK